MKPKHYFAHWDIFEDYCVYCGKYKPFGKQFGATCSCFRLEEPHGIRRRICHDCIMAIKKEVENSGFSSLYILNMLENRQTHGEVIWE